MGKAEEISQTNHGFELENPFDAQPTVQMLSPRDIQFALKISGHT